MLAIHWLLGGGLPQAHTKIRKNPKTQKQTYQNRKLLFCVNTQIYQSEYYDSTGAVFLSCGDFLARMVAATMGVGGVLSAGTSPAQHCRLCWLGVRCETDPSMYPYVIVWSINCPFLFPVFICMYLSVS